MNCVIVQFTRNNDSYHSFPITVWLNLIGWSFMKLNARVDHVDKGEGVGRLGVLNGTYTGTAQHSNGSLLSISYQVKRITNPAGSDMYCVWISRDDTAALEAA